MPGVTLHFLLADRAVDRWREGGDPPPFDLEDAEALNAFYHGSVGPDLGYFPGGWRLLSDLAHCYRTGALTRALLRSAGSERERAFAWGWLTHVLADQMVHPWIGRGVGELLTGTRDRFVDGSSSFHAHLRVELGVDAWHAERAPEARRRRLRVAFDDQELRFLARAYHATYAVEFPIELVVRSHKAANRRANQALQTVGIVGALMRRDVGPALRMVVRLLGAADRRAVLRCTALAYVRPVEPSAWLLDGVDAAMTEHADRFAEHYRTGGRGLEDFNLDTGRLIESESDHAGTLRALRGLADLTARSNASAPRLIPAPAHLSASLS